jgi:hypothetical protein
VINLMEKIAFGYFHHYSLVLLQWREGFGNIRTGWLNYNGGSTRRVGPFMRKQGPEIPNKERICRRVPGTLCTGMVGADTGGGAGVLKGDKDGDEGEGNGADEDGSDKPISTAYFSISG